MRRTSLIMYISAALLVILHVHSGFSVAAPPRINPHDASPATVAAASSSSSSSPPRPGILPGTARQTTSAGGVQKRSADAQTTLFAPEKALQTMVSSSVSQPRSANDAWSADSTTGSSAAAVDAKLVCNCSTGAESILDPDECDAKTGQCLCEVGYTGLQCEDCEESYFTNGTSGCLPCACDSYGAVHQLCDSYGTCVCKSGVYGPKCDDCHPGFFHFSSTGCRPCQCNNRTSNCHPQSGVCLNCEGNTQGSNCEECKPGFYRKSEDCLPCPCTNASSNGTCHIDAGGSAVCDRCLAPYAGPQCDQCGAGFFKRDALCAPCDCSGNADPQGPPQICHPQTGHCLSCINDTTGAQCQLCAPGYAGDAKAHNCTRPNPRLLPTAVQTTSTTEAPTSPPTRSTAASSSTAASKVPSTSNSSSLSSTTTQALLTSLGSPTDNTTAALTEVSWTQFNIVILAVIILVVLLLLGFVGGVYTYREYQNRKLNAPFWTIELKEDNISFSSYHDSIPNADVSGLLEDEANEVAPNGQLALTTQGNNCYKA
ncbi:multiple epidermal growth factor-like domains protein 9 isoform X2 [Eucyclogobius newberryi]|uniref:multiple epidermal growth factor-like domains protein 9 isoform X2 n=1 Tax=Eucyclogobius newberryi TaxID=166745 RepID=UPI003B58E498